ncbi:carboxypeptidase regulatory-like domain-containing protein [Nocardioides flavescens]|uniref:alpha-amylase n=1 Tax=Nocardioides flavescens TaxID=2691959 RepID=A0A6L7ETL4_9ACTN|nr:carboxypeptidase regulatory-like domain-containing protein [Nocardioides flavescens]MXG88798.1 hypothetical protein [Nocardioides flavescens]
MQVDVSPRRLDAVPGVPVPVTVTITNTGDLIAGFVLRVLGADPTWVELPDDELSLFPEETRTVLAQITVPPGITAGERRISVQVRELTPPEASSIDEVVLRVPEAPLTTLRVDPLTATSGRSARFSLLVENSGNTPLSGSLLGQDPERRVKFRFDPPALDLAPGEHGVVDVRASARQTLFGAPVLRVLTVGVGTPGPATPAAPPAAPADPADPAADAADAARLKVPGRRRKTKLPPPAIPEDVPVTHATFVQKALMTRGPLSLLGLLLAVTVFAVVITLALSRLVGQSAADRNLALEVAAARDSAASGAGSGTGVGGTVSLLTSGAPVAGVAVAVYAAGDTADPVATTATDDTGVWKVGELPVGDYKITYRGAGFTQLWYPQALDASNADTVTLGAGEVKLGLDVALGGVPASIAGRVVGDDVSTATLTLRTPVGTAGAAPTSGDSATTAEQGAQVMSVPIGADGTFQLSNVPSPSIYDLVVTKPGYATSTQRIDIGAGEERTGVEIALRKGDGVISGTLSSAGGPLGGATVTATSGTSSVTTMSLTEGDVGAFTLRGLTTPGSYTVVASLDGYASQTMTLSLAEGQRLVGVGMTLGKASGAIGGTVTLRDGSAAEGVVVTITDGTQTIQTATSSEGKQAKPGRWTATGLSLPGTYTVTFSRADLSSQTLSVVLDSAGNLVSGGSSASGVDATMEPATAVLEGTVTQKLSSGATTAAGEVTVTLSSGTDTYSVVSASVPAALAGHYRFESVPPGTYTLSTSRTGITPTSTIVELAAGDERDYPLQLAASASVSGTVVRPGGEPVPAGWVVELYRSGDYPRTPYLTTTTGAGGTFSFADVDAPQAYVVQVRRSAAAAPAGSRTVQVSTSQAVTTTITTTAGQSSRPLATTAGTP